MPNFPYYLSRSERNRFCMRRSRYVLGLGWDETTFEVQLTGVCVSDWYLTEDFCTTGGRLDIYLPEILQDFGKTSSSPEYIRVNGEIVEPSQVFRPPE